MNTSFWKILSIVFVVFFVVTGGYIFYLFKQGLFEECEKSLNQEQVIQQSCKYSLSSENMDLPVKVYRSFTKMEDSDGNFIGYLENVLKLDSEKRTFEINIEFEQYGYILTGTYEDTEGEIKLIYDPSEFNDLDSSLNNLVLNVYNGDISILEFASEPISTLSPKKGDMFVYFLSEDR